ncbi:hypothetical protein DESA109040_19720 [Deinococcus saxicola]
MEARPILDLTGNACGKSGLFTVMAVWTDFDLGLVFRDVELHFRQAAKPLLGVCSGQDVMDLTGQ